MLNHAVSIDPQNPLSHFFLGVMYERQSDPNKAMAEFREANRLIEVLSEPTPTLALGPRIVRDERQDIYYLDKFGKQYLLNDIIRPLKKRLSQ